MTVMTTAQAKIERQLRTLEATERQVRQEVITSEIIEIAAGEMASRQSGKPVRGRANDLSDRHIPTGPKTRVLTQIMADMVRICLSSIRVAGVFSGRSQEDQMSKPSSAPQLAGAVPKDRAVKGRIAVAQKAAIVPIDRAKTAGAAQCGPDCAAADHAAARQGVYDLMNKTTRATMANFTLGIAPSALALAYLDWATHLATSPGKQLKLIGKAVSKFERLAGFTGSPIPT